MTNHKFLSPSVNAGKIIELYIFSRNGFPWGHKYFKIIWHSFNLTLNLIILFFVSDAL